MDYRLLLIKYIAHVVAAEGPTFAGNPELIAPCDMGPFNFTSEEIETLKNDLFAEALRSFELMAR